MSRNRRRDRKALLSLAKQFRSKDISAIEALCRVIQISRLPPEMAIEWFAELVHQLGQSAELRTRPLVHPPVRDALDHLVAS
ncbi:hypothetical protein [Actinomadura violacea]|uniref:Uncharacterized protein n=1 Tax=Actinomadura violacea TaxID=2819934 RepID=A0ABS3S669_9ACTN|nr:hypothetical protein [Actinomadura violacea]MBO2464497.1 hypothetical protein [Actinomadura violacea]